MAEGEVARPAGSLRLVAPAKLNLWLSVTGRRSDGFHELDSLMVLLELADELRTVPGGSGLSVTGPTAADAPRDEANLAWRGFRYGLGGARPSVRLTLDKRIPVAAGLGGGSSDAAAGWRLGRRHGGHRDAAPGPSARLGLASIGADVPFFAAQCTAARVNGIGETVVPTTVPPAEVVLVHPPFGLATAAVFAELKAGEWSGPGADGRSGAESGADVGPGRNDLEAAARRLRPELDAVFSEVRRAGGEPHLTGSGPTVFVLTADRERADAVADRVGRAGLGTTRTRLRREPASIEPMDDPAEGLQ